MEPQKAQKAHKTQKRASSHGAQLINFCFVPYVLFVPFVASFDGNIVANVKS
jgi:hypothetical protein